MSADEALFDHGYTTPSCEVMKHRLNDAIDRQEELQRKLRNASLREQRTKKRCGTIVALGGFLRILNPRVRLVFTFAKLSGLLLRCGDIESNPGPVFSRCAACGVMQKDTAKISYFAYPIDPERPER
jgi:hypothetical protein